MVNTRAILGISLSVLAMGILIAGMSIERWVVAKNEGGQQQYENDMIYIGLKTWSYVPSAPGSVTLTGKLTDDFAPVARDSLVSAAELDAGGNSMIGCGVVALIAGTVGLVLVSISLAGKQPRFKALGVFLTVVSLALVVTGTLLYARKMYVYWGFVVFMIAGFMMLFAVIITGGQLFSPIASRQRFGLGTFVALVSMCLAVAAMATKAWVSQDNLRVNCSGGSAVLDVGLKRWQITVACPNNPTATTDGPLTDLPSQFPSNYRSYFNRLDQGGNYVIAFGTIGIVFALIGIVGNWLALYQTPKRTTYQIVGLIFTFLSGVFLILGMVLHAQQLYIHASFMLAVASAFLLFSAVIVMIVSSMTFAPSSGSIHGKTGSKHSHRSSTDKAPAPDPNAYDPPIVPAAENVSV